MLALALAGACQRGPRLCIFDGTSIGITSMPMVALHEDGTLDPENRYSWQEFPWPTDPQFETVQRLDAGWAFRGRTGGQGWSFTGAFPADGGAFVRADHEGSPPAVDVEGASGRPTLLRYRVKPCRQFQGSQSGVRTCLGWGRELNARTKLHCE